MSTKKSYDDEMFEFYTSNEINLQGLILANKHFNKVKDRIILDFWLCLKYSLEEYLEDEPDWKVELQESQIKNWNSKLYVYDINEPKSSKNQLPNEMICFEKLAMDMPYCGIWINKDSESFKMDERMSEFNSIKKELSKFTIADINYDEWMPYWTYIAEINFNDDNGLLRLIGESRMEIVENCLVLFKQFFNAYKSIKSV